jgi:hypothetical protein
MLFGFQFVENLHSSKGFMNFVGEFKHLYEFNFPTPVVNVVMITLQGFKTHRTKLLNNLHGAGALTIKPNSQIGFHAVSLHFAQ